MGRSGDPHSGLKRYVLEATPECLDNATGGNGEPETTIPKTPVASIFSTASKPNVAANAAISEIIEVRRRTQQQRHVRR